MLQVEFGQAWDVLVCLVQGFHNMRLKISHLIPRFIGNMPIVTPA